MKCLNPKLSWNGIVLTKSRYHEGILDILLQDNPKRVSILHPRLPCLLIMQATMKNSYAKCRNNLNIRELTSSIPRYHYIHHPKLPWHLSLNVTEFIYPWGNNKTQPPAIIFPQSLFILGDLTLHILQTRKLHIKLYSFYKPQLSTLWLHGLPSWSWY